MVSERVVTTVDDACAECRDRHVWAGDDARARSICPRRVCQIAESGLPRGRDYRHVRTYACDVDLWRPWIITRIVGISAHPAQAAWSADEIITEIVCDLRMRSIAQAIADSESAKTSRAGRRKK